MNKSIIVFLIAILCVFSFVNIAYADPKAFELFGIYDPANKLKDSERGVLNASLKGIYDKYGVSAYLCLLSGSNEKMGDFVTQFFIENVAPYTDVIKRGVIFAYDEKTKSNFMAPFLNTDDRIMSAFSAEYIRLAITSSFASASSVFEIMKNMSEAIRKRADEYYGENATGKVEKPKEESPGPSASDIAEAKADVYIVGGERILSIYGTVGERELIAVQKKNEGDVEAMLVVYKTDSIAEDIEKYMNALRSESWLVTHNEGTYNKGVLSLAKNSNDKGYILIVSIEFRGASYQLNMGKIPGTLTLKE
jgi:hypothetical protein